MEIFEALSLSPHYSAILLINLAIAFALLVALKFISGAISGVNALHELSEKDNPAFGISIAGVAVAITIMMTGVMTGEASAQFSTEVMLVTGYGVLGLILMTLTRFIFDRVSMPGFSVKDEILKGNMAAGIVDAGNVIATAIIIRAAMVWIEDTTIYHAAFVVGAYILSQAILSLASLYRLHIFKKRNDKSLQDSIQGGNIALAWRFTGYRLGIAFAITAASGMVPYTLETPVFTAGLWVGVSIVMMVLVSVLVVLADLVILRKIDVNEEVDKQRNIAIGAIQCAITISVGLIIAALST